MANNETETKETETMTDTHTNQFVLTHISTVINIECVFLHFKPNCFVCVEKRNQNETKTYSKNNNMQSNP